MSSLYAKLIQVIEQKITPMAGAVGQQKYVTSIRDGFITALPFMIVGSFMLVFIFPPFSPDTSWGFARAWLQFSLDHREALMLPFNFSMGIMTIFISVGIAASLAKHHDLDALTAGMLSLMAFLLVAAPVKRRADLYRLFLRARDLHGHSGGYLLYRAVCLPEASQYYYPPAARSAYGRCAFVRNSDPGAGNCCHSAPAQPLH